jgi:hypothetical protein
MPGRDHRLLFGEDTGMIRPDGTIHFAEELFGIIDRFLEDYQDIEGDIQDALDRSLVVAYALCALRCDLELLSDCVEKQAVFGHVSPRRVMDKCSEKDPAKRAARHADSVQLLNERGWLVPEGRR